MKHPDIKELIRLAEIELARSRIALEESRAKSAKLLEEMKELGKLMEKNNERSRSSE